jgi:acyl carrier protein
MNPNEVVEELRAMLVTRLKFEPGRAAGVLADAPLPKGTEGAVGLDSLDFIELSLAIEERYGIVMDDSEELARHFASLETLSRFIAAKI